MRGRAHSRVPTPAAASSCGVRRRSSRREVRRVVAALVPSRHGLPSAGDGGVNSGHNCSLQWCQREVCAACCRPWQAILPPLRCALRVTTRPRVDRGRRAAAAADATLYLPVLSNGVNEMSALLACCWPWLVVPPPLRCAPRVTTLPRVARGRRAAAAAAVRRCVFLLSPMVSTICLCCLPLALVVLPPLRPRPHTRPHMSPHTRPHMSPHTRPHHRRDRHLRCRGPSTAYLSAPHKTHHI